MEEKKIINLVVVDDSFDNEEKIVSKLRAAGHTARSTRVEDDEDLFEVLNLQVPDLIIFFEDLELITLKDAVNCIRKDKKTESCRIISVNKTKQPNVVNAIRTGAVDATCFTNIDHLLLIIAREHHSLISARQINKFKTAFIESEKRCTSLLDSSRAAIAYIHEGMHVYSNQSYLDIFDIEESDDLEGLPILDMVAIDGRTNFKTVLRDYGKNKNCEKKLDTTLRKPDGNEFKCEMEFSPAQIDGEPCIQIIIRKEDVTSEEMERQLKVLSQKDQLTGLFNRQYCTEKLERVIVDCAEKEYTAAMMEIHIDNFETIKHSVGVVDADQYIIEAAKTLNDAINADDILSRFTHDCFSVIAINYNKENIESYAADLQKAISTLETNINNTKINTTCSIGIALIDSDSPEYNDILARLEKAAASAKQQGANQIVIYIPDKDELTLHELDTKFKVELTNALKNDYFFLHYQPIVSLHGDTDERYEVFVRMKGENDDKLTMPQHFLPAAERIGMAIAIDRWVLYKTIQEYVARLKTGKKTRFFIKLSAPSIKDDTLLEWLSYQIKEKNIPPNTLNFAVKETVAVTNLRNAKVLSHGLKKLQCGFVLDDFGTGTNPYQLLDHIHTDYVRLERSFMEGLSENPQNQESLKLLAEQAEKLGKITIAQHVPDAVSLSLLWGMGFNFIQGYFLQEPMPTMEYDFTEMSG